MSRQAQKRRARQEKTEGRLHRRGLLGPDDGTLVVTARETSVAIQDLLADLETTKTTLRVLFVARRTVGLSNRKAKRWNIRLRDIKVDDMVATIKHHTAHIRETKAKIAALSS